MNQPRDDVYGAYDPSHFQTAGPNQHTQSPIVTGTSVLAAKFKDGVVIAADNLGMSDQKISQLLKHLY
jgi:20S proteasome subunit beta 7